MLHLSTLERDPKQLKLLATELKQLAALFKDGLLTDEEYSHAKNRLLGM